MQILIELQCRYNIPIGAKNFNNSFTQQESNRRILNSRNVEFGKF